MRSSAGLDRNSCELQDRRPASAPDSLKGDLNDN